MICLVIFVKGWPLISIHVLKSVMEFERFMNLFEENSKIIQRKQRAMSRKLLWCDSLRTVRSRRSSQQTSQKRGSQNENEKFFLIEVRRKNIPKKDTRNETKVTRNTTFGSSTSTSSSISKKKTKKCFQQIRLITFHFSEVQRFQGFSFT